MEIKSPKFLPQLLPRVTGQGKNISEDVIKILAIDHALEFPHQLRTLSLPKQLHRQTQPPARETSRLMLQ